jgi:O-antigen/teichoic acid export membrane protein
MSSIKINIAANLVGKIWSAAIAVLLIPLYIKYLGIESYGLVGFYGTLIGSMALLDLGLSTTINRELAKFKSGKGTAQDARNLSFSLECLYWGIGLLVALLVIALSWFIANHWVKAEHLPISVVRQSVMLMGAVIAFQWPISLYSGGLTGLNKQVLNNIIIIVMSTLRAAGVIIVLKYYSPTLQAFFLWQAALSLVYVFIMRVALWKEMPKDPAAPQFSKAQIKNIWRFAAGMTGISLVTFFLSQIDKIVLSKILPLSQFGYYSLAFSIASAISMIVVPVSITFFPRFSGLVAQGKEGELKKLYHQASRLMATFIFPVCLVLVFFMEDILRVWTKNSVTTENTYLLAQVLVIGSMFNALMVIPYNLLIANGRTRFTIYQNTIAAIILVPMLFLWTHLYGALGATFVWVIVNVGYVLISQPLMHRKLMKGELWKWYWNDTLLPLLTPLAVVLVIKYSLQFFLPGFQLNLLLLGFIFVAVFGASLLNMSYTREFIKNIFKG